MDIDNLLRSHSVAENRVRIQSVRDRLFGQATRIAPTHIEVHRSIGEGAFGSVYLATDRRVDRRIALKVLRFANDDQRLRLDREAQALARLCHPNVVQLYDSGVADRSTYYLALEHVEGECLGDWLKARPRRLDEILQVFLQLARGLLEAHRRSLVHRDFKPDNVMVRRDGVSKVLDFGLVKLTAEGLKEARRRRLDLVGPTDEHSIRGPRPQRSYSASSLEEVNTEEDRDPGEAAVVDRPGPLELSLTSSQGFVGSPPYASPEQLEGQEVDARSDQFSFCVTMFEACYGFHPFGRGIKSRYERIRRIKAGEIQKFRSKRSIPRWLRALLLRGLKADPNERHADFKEIIDVLEARLRPPARPVRNVLAGALLTTLALVSVPSALWSQREPLEWSDPGQWAATSWEDTRHRLEQAYGPLPQLDRYPERWQQIADDLQEQWRPWNRLEPQYDCLRRSREVFQYEADLLLHDAEADPRREIFMHRPHLHTAQLNDPEGCRADEPRSTSPDVTRRLLRARRLHRQGHDAEALALLDEVRREIPPSGDPLSGAVERLRASVLMASRDPRAWDVLGLAEHGSGGDLGLMIETALERAEVGILLDRPRHEIEALLARAEIWQSTLLRDEAVPQEVSVRITGLRQLVEGHAALTEGRYEDAVTAYEVARERLAALRASAEPEDDPALAYLDLHIAAAMAQLDDRKAETRPLVERSFATLRTQLGKDHPALPSYALQAARALSMSGHIEPARQMFEQTARLGKLAGPSGTIEAIRAEAELLFMDIAYPPEGSSLPPEPLEQRAEQLERSMEALADTNHGVRLKEASRIWYVITLAYDQARSPRRALTSLPRWLESAHDERERQRGCAALHDLHQQFHHDDPSTEKIVPSSQEREIFRALKSECS